MTEQTEAKQAELYRHMREVAHANGFDGLTDAIARAAKAEALLVERDWQSIDTAPKDGTVVDIWVTGPGSRRIADCAWLEPSRAAWGDRFGDDQHMPYQWVTPGGFALDRRNGEATHWRHVPTLRSGGPHYDDDPGRPVPRHGSGPAGQPRHALHAKDKGE